MKRKKIPLTPILIGAFVVGLFLLLYPSVSNYINRLHSSRAVNLYSEEVAKMKEEQLAQMYSDAQAFSYTLTGEEFPYVLSEEKMAEYMSLLNIGGDGVMGYIEIPAIDVILPIYHGTDDNVLQIAAGHMEWTSMPVGGKGTHCVISGHRGLPSASLFTDLDMLVEGDLFMISVLDRVLTYEVDQIRIVVPSDTSDLMVVEGEDYCTLLTCTPYGVNSHRLLVRGHRIENPEEAVSVNIISDAIQVEPSITASVIGVPVLILLIIWQSIRTRVLVKKKKSKSENDYVDPFDDDDL